MASSRDGAVELEPIPELRMANCWLEHCSTSEFVTYTVPTASISAELPQAESITVQEEHASWSDTFLPPYALSKGFLLARIVESGRTLELRWLNTTHEASTASFADLDASNNLMPVRFVFPAKIVPGVTMSLLEDERRLQVCALTEEGYLHVLTFNSPHFFYATNLEDTDWSEEIIVGGLEGKRPTLVHGIDSSRIVVACSDGSTICVTIGNGPGAILDEVEFKSASSFSIRSLVPSFSTRNISDLGSDPQASPSQLISVASQVSNDRSSSIAIGVTRDRKLKIWNVENGTCLKSTDLPVATSDSRALVTSMDRDTATNAASSQIATTAPLIKLFPDEDADSEYSSYLTLYSPASNGSVATFFVYGVITGSAGSVNELYPICERRCESFGSLVDFTLAPSMPDGVRAWCLYSIWIEGGEGILRFSELSEFASDSEEQTSWTQVAKAASTTATWTASYFDALLSSPDSDVIQVFTTHLFYPGRYPLSTLDYALAEYEEILSRELGNDNLPAAFNGEYDSIAERICALVGSSIQLEVSQETGSFEFDDYRRRLQNEWLRFIALVNESRTSGLHPLSLVVSSERGLAAVVARNAVQSLMLRDDADMAYAVAETFARQLSPSNPVQLRKHHSNILPLLECVALIGAALDQSTYSSFEEAVHTVLRRPFTNDPVQVAFELYTQHLEESLDEEDLQDSLSEKLQQIPALVPAFASLEQVVAFVSASSPSQELPTPLEAGLIADGLISSIQSRHKLAVGYLALLFFVNAELNDLLGSDTQILASAFAVVHNTTMLKFVSERSAVPKLSSPSSLTDRLSGMNFGAAQDDQSTPTFSILHALARSTTVSKLSTMPMSLSAAVSTVFRETRLLESKTSTDDREQDAVFALRIYDLDLPDVAFQVTQFLPRGSGVCHVQGLCAVALGRYDEAETSFTKASAAFLSPDASASLQAVLPSEVTSPATYFGHVLSLFVESSIESSVRTFARMAIEAASTKGHDQSMTKQWWTRLFKAHLSLSEYDDAFKTMMQIPNDEARSGCLGQLVSAVTAAGLSSLLARWPFAGLRLELERVLAFRARNADPFSAPNYFDALFNYYTARGDHRSAALAMLQQAKKMAQLQSQYDFHTVATAQCQSYLTCINSLSLVNERDAWLALPLDSSVSAHRKRRRVVYNLPDDEFSSTSPAAEVLTLEDVRKEYRLSLSRLEMGDDFAELQRSNFVLDAESAVALHMRLGAVDDAFATAACLGVDMSSLFENLVDKCIQLADPQTTGIESEWILRVEESALWDGTLASKGWLYLRKRLERHDNVSGPIYHHAVLERIAQTNQASMPSWLVDFYVSHDPRRLVWTAIRFDRLDEAFAHSLSILNDPKAQSMLPFSCFDQLLQLPDGEDSATLTADELGEKKHELRRAIDQVLGQSSGKGARPSRAKVGR